MTRICDYIFCFLILFSIFSSSTVFALQFRKIYFFGDSITDSGNNPVAPYTNAHGSVWSVILARFYGLDLQPSSAGGTNYAWGGAQTSGESLPYLVPSIEEQVDELIQESDPLDRRSLYIIWGGHNDFFNLLLGAGNTPTQAAQNIKMAASLLHQKGAKNILVNNICDLGRLPAFAADPMAAAISSMLATDFNAQLLRKLNSLSFDVLQINMFGMSQALLNNPVKYGFRSDAATQVCADITSDCSGYIFIVDGVHLTTDAHQFIADYVFSVLTAANFYAAIAESTLPIIQVYNAHLREEILHTTCRKYLRWIPFVSASYAPELQNENPNRPRTHYDQDGVFGLLGLKWCTNNFISGFAFGHSANKLDFKHAGDVHNHTNFLSLFSAYQNDRAYVHGLVHLGWCDFKDINRRFDLGSFSASNHGGTSGKIYAAQLISGYHFVQNHLFATGPIVKIEYDYSHVNGFTESGTENATLVAYKSQTYDSFISGLGWELHYKARFNNRPFQSHLEVTTNQLWGNDMRDIHYHLTSLPGSHGVITVPRPKGNFTAGNFSIHTQLRNGVDIGLNYGAQLGEQHFNQQWVLADINFPL